MFFPTSVKTQAQSPSQNISLSLQALNDYVYSPIKDCKFEFNCCFLGLNIISSGRRATDVLQFRIKQNEPRKFLRVSSSPQNCNQVYDNCCILHPHSVFHQSHSSCPPPPMSPNSSLPILSLSFFFTPKLLMKGADGLFCGWCQLH